ncbi:hypothetical protein L2E82_14105 [Cichorium intybus]|uniref:Uncharacterized protein n=1 Tax=Cichorium intybus TaxID=13427 RepID=A0ACB9EZ20_CICIN|nr:hypothetical protein L2E82_14105 [Cichorium intybus]
MDWFCEIVSRTYYCVVMDLWLYLVDDMCLLLKLKPGTPILSPRYDGGSPVLILDKLDSDGSRLGHGRKNTLAIMFPGVMMLTGTATFVYRSSPARTVCLASRTDTDQLRDQLDQLHYEASNTRDKANKARQRLLRLSEAAEKLQRQAAISVQTGKENDARDLLLQKKKTMQALEKTKSRIELLDELSTKLIEAISFREQQLVGTVAQDLEIEREDDTSPIRVVSPPSEKDLQNASDDQELQDKTNNMPINDEINKLQELLQVPDTDSDLINGLTGLTSYKDLLDRIDQRLNKIEAELMMVVKFSRLILENESQENVKVQQLMEVVDAVKNVRQRIANIVRKKEEMNG